MTPEEPNNPFSWRNEIGVNPTPKQVNPTPPPVPPVDRYANDPVVLEARKLESQIRDKKIDPFTMKAPTVRKRKSSNAKEGSALGDFFMLMLGIPPRSILQNDRQERKMERGTFTRLYKTYRKNNNDMIQRIVDLTTVVNSIANDVRSALNAIEKLSAQGSFATPKNTMQDLKPQTVTYDNKEYLYYPDAPKNRKFYEKSKKGTPGRIVGKKVQKRLTPLIREQTAERQPTAPTATEMSKEIVKLVEREELKTIEKILVENMPEREQNITDIINKLIQKQKSNEVDMGEEKAMLEAALLDALTTVIRNNPELLKCQGGGSGLGEDMFRRRMRNVNRGGRPRGAPRGAPTPNTSTPAPPTSTVPPTPESPTGKLPDAPKGTDTATRAAKIAKYGEKVGKAAKFLLKKLPFVGLALGLGYGVYRASTGDYSGAAMEVASGAASTVPGLGTAASIGIDAALAAKDAGVLNQSNPAVSTGQINRTPNPQPNLTVTEKPSPVLNQSNPAVSTGQINRTPNPQPNLTVTEKPSPVLNQPIGQEIVEMNRTINSGTNTIHERVIVKPVVRNVTQTNVLPTIVQDNKIKVFNDEGTFARVQSQDVDFPSSYGNLNMG